MDMKQYLYEHCQKCRYKPERPECIDWEDCPVSAHEMSLVGDRLVCKCCGELLYEDVIEVDVNGRGHCSCCGAYVKE